MEERERLKKFERLVSRVCISEKGRMGGSTCDALSARECDKVPFRCRRVGESCVRRTNTPCGLFVPEIQNTSCSEARRAASESGMSQEWAEICQTYADKESETLLGVLMRLLKAPFHTMQELAERFAPALASFCVKVIARAFGLTWKLLKASGSMLWELMRFAFMHPTCFSRLVNEVICSKANFVSRGMRGLVGVASEHADRMSGIQQLLCSAMRGALCYVKRTLGLIKFPLVQAFARQLFTDEGACATWFTRGAWRNVGQTFTWLTKVDPAGTVVSVQKMLERNKSNFELVGGLAEWAGVLSSSASTMVGTKAIQIVGGQAATAVVATGGGAVPVMLASVAGWAVYQTGRSVMSYFAANPLGCPREVWDDLLDRLVKSLNFGLMGEIDLKKAGKDATATPRTSVQPKKAVTPTKAKAKSTTAAKAKTKPVKPKAVTLKAKSKAVTSTKAKTKPVKPKAVTLKAKAKAVSAAKAKAKAVKGGGGIGRARGAAASGRRAPVRPRGRK